jgi:hypothetical protein
MSRLPQMVGTLALVACAGCYHATVKTGVTPSTLALQKSFASGGPLELAPPWTVESASPRPDGPAKIEAPLALVGRLVCPDPREPPPPSPAGGRTNEELMANETFQRAMTDVLRLRIAVGFCELRQDTLTLDLGDGAFTSASTEYNLSRVHAAYRGLTEFRRESALELRYQDRLVGWYTFGGLAWTEKPKPQPATPAAQAEVTAAAEAPDDTVRSGLHFNAGFGGGAFDRQCAAPDCDHIDSEIGVSGFLAIGGLLDPKTVLGVEGTGWTKEIGNLRTQVYSIMAQVTRYAGSTSGLFLRGGVGLVGYDTDADFSATALGFSGRLGYEIGGGKVHVVPYVGYVRSFDGTDLKRDGDDVGFNFVISQLQFGLGVSVY